MMEAEAPGSASAEVNLAAPATVPEDGPLCDVAPKRQKTTHAWNRVNGKVVPQQSRLSLRYRRFYWKSRYVAERVRLRPDEQLLFTRKQIDDTFERSSFGGIGLFNEDWPKEGENIEELMAEQ